MEPTAESDWSCFSGRVWKRALPVFDGPPAPDAPARKRLLLPQGELAQVHDSEEAIQYLAMIELREGTVRGNHFHKAKREFIYVFSGQGQLLVEDIEAKLRETVSLMGGDLVFISPGLAHTLRVIKSGQAVEFSPSRFNATDTYRYLLA